MSFSDRIEEEQTTFQQASKVTRGLRYALKRMEEREDVDLYRGDAVLCKVEKEGVCEVDYCLSANHCSGCKFLRECWVEDKLTKQLDVWQAEEDAADELLGGGGSG